MVREDFGDLRGRFSQSLVAEPVAGRAVVVGPEPLLQPRRRVEGFVRVEGLELQQAAVGVRTARKGRAGNATDASLPLLVRPDV